MHDLNECRVSILPRAEPVNEASNMKATSVKDCRLKEKEGETLS